MPPLSSPMELLDLPAEGELVTRVTKWEQGVTTIKPARAPDGVEVTVFRLHVPLEDKKQAPQYWDVTATTLHPSLLAHLPTIVADRRWIRIRKFGVAPRARFQLEIFPPGDGGPAFYGVRQ